MKYQQIFICKRLRILIRHYFFFTSYFFGCIEISKINFRVYVIKLTNLLTIQ